MMKTNKKLFVRRRCYDFKKCSKKGILFSPCTHRFGIHQLHPRLEKILLRIILYTNFDINGRKNVKLAQKLFLFYYSEIHT